VAPEQRGASAPPGESAPFELPFLSGDEALSPRGEMAGRLGDLGSGAGDGVAAAPSSAGRRETPTPPLQCLVAAADSARVSVGSIPARATFVNGDLTIALQRAPIGEWIYLDAAPLACRAAGPSLYRLSRSAWRGRGRGGELVPVDHGVEHLARRGARDRADRRELGRVTLSVARASRSAVVRRSASGNTGRAGNAL
jgi:hypothetical protein